MMNFRLTHSVWVPICYLVLISGCSFTRNLFAPTLSVAVASNIQKTFGELSAEFHRGTGITLQPTFGRSDSLASWIERGAPFDLFLSADTTLTAKLYAKHLATTMPMVFSHEQLMLWSTTEVTIGRDLGLLLSPSIQRIAIADPQIESSGQSSVAMLQRAQVYDSLRQKIVFAGSNAEVNRLVETGEVEAGINLCSTMRTPLQKNDQVYALADSQFSPMPQSVVILSHGSEHHLEAAQYFVWFLNCPYGQDLLEQNGYK
jgi:molybdate transport system substrate-binding protein